MKKTIQTLLLFAVLTLAGCAKECEPFYTGKNCKERITDAYVGNYTGTLISTGSATQTYTVTNGTDANEIYIGNLQATLSSSNYFTIPNQTRLLNGALYSISGSGQITASTLTFTLIVNNDIAQFTGAK
jgi:hypothetical protein